VNIFRQESLNAIPIPLRLNADRGDPCTLCGWRPEFIEIIEILVHGRHDSYVLRDRGVFDLETSVSFGDGRRALNRLA
jgi:hypothetical protein